MDKIAYVYGYMSKMEKEAAAPLLDEVLRGASVQAAYIGIPGLAGYAAGRVAGGLVQPSEKVLDVVQAKYVKQKLEQALNELEAKEKIERIRSENAGKPASIRF